MLQAPSKPLKLEKLSKILFTLTLKSGKNYAWKPLKVAIFCRKRPWKPWNRYEKMARHPVWNFIPSLIFRSLALSYRLGNKRGENVRKLGQNMSGNCQECQEFSTLQKSGHSVLLLLRHSLIGKVTFLAKSWGSYLDLGVMVGWLLPGNVGLLATG